MEALSLALAALFAHLLEKAKQSHLVSASSNTAQKFAALFAAAIGAVGITMAWSVDPATNLGTLMFTGIPTTMDQWVTFAVAVFQQYWLQKGYYLAAIKPQMTGVRVKE